MAKIKWVKPRAAKYLASKRGEWISDDGVFRIEPVFAWLFSGRIVGSSLYFMFDLHGEYASVKDAKRAAEASSNESLHPHGCRRRNFQLVRRITMAYRITRAEQVTIDGHTDTIRAKYRAFIRAIEEMNAEIEMHTAKVQSLLSDLDEAKDEAAGFLEDIHRAHEEEFDLATEKWQESERGESVRAWLDELQSQITCLQDGTDWTPPEQADTDILDPAEYLEDMYMEPESP